MAVVKKPGWGNGVRVAILVALLIAGFVLRLLQNGNIEKLPGIIIAIAGAVLPVAVALLAVYWSSARSKQPPSA